MSASGKAPAVGPEQSLLGPSPLSRRPEALSVPPTPPSSADRRQLLSCSGFLSPSSSVPETACFVAPWQSCFHSKAADPE